MLQVKFKDTKWVFRSRNYRSTDNTGANQRSTKHYTEKQA